MGKAIIISGADYSAKGLGVVSLPGKTITPQTGAIYSATTFRVVESGVYLASVSWSISNSTLASLVSNADGSCTVTPLLNINSSAVTLTAVAGGTTLTLSFVPALWMEEDITSALASSLVVRKRIGGWHIPAVTDNAKCTLPCVDISALLTGNPVKLQVNLKSGFDMVLGMGIAPGVDRDPASGFAWYDKDGNTTSFSWITNSQTALIPVTSGWTYLGMNFRYDNGTTTFANTTTLSDLVDSIKLYKTV